MGKVPLAAVDLDCASRRENPWGLERSTRSPSDSWTYLPLRTKSTLTIDYDRVATQEVGTVATVETMPFAGHDEVEAATSSTHLSLGSGLEVNTPCRP